MRRFDRRARDPRCGAHRSASLCALAALLLAGCSGPGPNVGMPDWFYKGKSGAGDSGDRYRALSLEEWHKDQLHCEADRCENLYGLDVTEAGQLRAEVYAPLDPSGPEFEFVILDSAGDELARPRDERARPRRIDVPVEPGEYFVRIRSRGDNGEALRYDVVARHVASPKRKRAAAPAAPVTRPAASKPVAAAAAVAPATVAGALLVTAEVLDVEWDDDDQAYVLLDRGEPDDVRREMRGQLREGDATIAEFVVVEVYQDGSRARVEGQLQGEVGIDTVAEIYRADGN